MRRAPRQRVGHPRPAARCALEPRVIHVIAAEPHEVIPVAKLILHFGELAVFFLKLGAFVAPRGVAVPVGARRNDIANEGMKVAKLQRFSSVPGLRNPFSSRGPGLTIPAAKLTSAVNSTVYQNALRRLRPLKTA